MMLKLQKETPKEILMKYTAVWTCFAEVGKQKGSIVEEGSVIKNRHKNTQRKESATRLKI